MSGAGAIVAGPAAPVAPATLFDEVEQDAPHEYGILLDSIEDEAERRRLIDATAASFAAYHSQGKWLPKPHLVEIDQAIMDGMMGIGPKVIIINLPPQHGKSELVSHWLPAWFLHKFPDKHVILTSYNSSFAEGWSAKVRDTLRELNERGATSTVFTRAQRGHWNTIQGGGMYAAGSLSGISGRPAHLLVIDDPFMDRNDAMSKARRDFVWDWFLSAARARLQPGAIIVIMHTRWHQDDLTGRLKQTYASIGALNKVRHIIIPAVAPEDSIVAGLHRPAGTALWPERFDANYLRETELVSGPQVWNAVYQQQPVAPGGSIFLREVWHGRNRFTPQTKPAVLSRVMSWDTGLNETDGSAYTACVVGEITEQPHRLLIVDVWRERIAVPQLPNAIHNLAQKHNQDGKLRAIFIEDMVSGTTALQTLKAAAKMPTRDKLFGFYPRGSKEFRAQRAAIWTGNGSIWLPEMTEENSNWLWDFEEELYDAPTGTYMDQVDAFAQLVLAIQRPLALGLKFRLESAGHVVDDRIFAQWLDDSYETQNRRAS